MSFVATILIVDDTPTARTSLEVLLTSPDYILAFACDGLEALAKATELTPDLILLDVMMPGMDGFEVCRRLRADPRLAEIPVIMITALDDQESRLQGIEAGADDFISKPFNRTELRARVRTITRLNRYRRLLAERSRFEWVVEQAQEGYLLVNSQDELLYANPQARLYLGLTGELSGTFLALAQKQYHCEPVEAWASWPDQAELATTAPRYLIRPETETAQAYWLQVALFDQSAGLESQRLIHLRDVTPQINARRDRYNFQSALSHKLRTPLTHITTGLELIAEEDEPLSPPEIITLAKSAIKGASRLREEIEDVLRYLNVARLNQTAPCALAEIPEIVAELSEQLVLSSVTLSGLEDKGNIHLPLSRRALDCVLREILENTEKFHPRQSPMVAITVAYSGPDAVILEIADDGLTLSPEQLDQVWTPYYQGEKYFTGQATGMGLGLPTVASLVWEVGGTCRLYNRDPGPGVVVALTLPVV